HRVFSRVGVSRGTARVRPSISIYAPGFPPVVDCGIKHHIPVGPCNGWTQGEGSVNTVSPIMTVLPLAPRRRRTASAGHLPGRRTAARWRGWGVAPGGAGSLGPPASAPAGRVALGMRADPSSSGRVVREHGTGWVHAAVEKAV